MPLVGGTGRNKYKKVYRPPGTPYARAEVRLNENISSRAIGMHILAYHADEALKKAISAFCKEFGRVPVFDKVVVEMVVTTCELTTTVFEIKDEGED